MNEDEGVSPPDEVAAGDPPAWDDDAGADPLAGSVFSQEIAGIDESDWDVDSSLIWGDDTAGIDEPGHDLGAGPDDFLV